MEKIIQPIGILLSLVTQAVLTGLAYVTRYLLADKWYLLKVGINLQIGMEEFLLTLHLAYPVRFVQGTRESGTLFQVETIL